MRRDQQSPSVHILETFSMILEKVSQNYWFSWCFTEICPVWTPVLSSSVSTFLLHNGRAIYFKDLHNMLLSMADSNSCAHSWLSAEWEICSFCAKVVKLHVSHRSLENENGEPCMMLLFLFPASTSTHLAGKFTVWSVLYLSEISSWLCQFLCRIIRYAACATHLLPDFLL